MRAGDGAQVGFCYPKRLRGPIRTRPCCAGAQRHSVCLARPVARPGRCAWRGHRRGGQQVPRDRGRRLRLPAQIFSITALLKYFRPVTLTRLLRAKATSPNWFPPCGYKCSLLLPAQGNLGGSSAVLFFFFFAREPPLIAAGGLPALLIPLLLNAVVLCEGLVPPKQSRGDARGGRACARMDYVPGRGRALCQDG